MMENTVLGKIFGPKRDEVTGEWRRLHNKELYTVYLTKYYSVDQIKKTDWRGKYHVMGEERCVQGFDGET